MVEKLQKEKLPMKLEITMHWWLIAQLTKSVRIGLAIVPQKLGRARLMRTGWGATSNCQQPTPEHPLPSHPIQLRAANQHRHRRLKERSQGGRIPDLQTIQCKGRSIFPMFLQLHTVSETIFGSPGGYFWKIEEKNQELICESLSLHPMLTQCTMGKFQCHFHFLIHGALPKFSYTLGTRRNKYFPVTRRN